MRLVLLIILSLYFSSSFSNEQASPYSFILKNGMEVVVIENNRAPVVAQMIWYNFGSGIEETGKSGLAHFMEHLMFKGTRKFPDNYYSNYISKIGGSENAFTSYDYTAYYQIFPKSELKTMIKILKPILLRFLTTTACKRLVVDLLRSICKQTTNTLDDKAVDMLEQQLFPKLN